MFNISEALIRLKIYQVKFFYFYFTIASVIQLCAASICDDSVQNILKQKICSEAIKTHIHHIQAYISSYPPIQQAINNSFGANNSTNLTENMKKVKEDFCQKTYVDIEKARKLPELYQNYPEAVQKSLKEHL